MEHISLNVDIRSGLGKSAVRQIRKGGGIPAVVYGEGSEAAPIVVNSREFAKAISSHAGGVRIFKFSSNEAKFASKLFLLKEAQLDPISRSVIHIDFLALTEGHKIHLTVPIKLVGEPVCIKQKTAVLNHIIHEVEVECEPSNIPNELVLDINNLVEGHSLHLFDIKLPNGVALREDPELAVVAASMMKAEEEASTTAETPTAPEVVPARGKQEKEE